MVAVLYVILQYNTCNDTLLYCYFNTQSKAIVLIVERFSLAHCHKSEYNISEATLVASDL